MDSLYLLEQHIIANPLVATGVIDLHLGYVRIVCVFTSINILLSRNRTWLMQAAFEGKMAMVQLLIAYKADVNASCR
jgi:hypothetical protein